MTRHDAVMDWFEISRRNVRSVQTTVGWIFWDPGPVDRYRAAGLPEHVAGPLGYLAARCAPLAGAGPHAVIAAFGSISATGIRGAFQLLGGQERFRELSSARDVAIDEGLRRHAPDIVEPLVELGLALWEVVDRLPLVGRVLFAAHLTMPRPADTLLSGWHAVNCLREWRGDTHWAVTVAEGLRAVEASILHNAWIGYEGDWLALWRGTPAQEIEAGWSSLEARGLAATRAVTAAGLALRQRIEDRTDRLTTLPWELLGEERSVELAEPPCAQLLARVDETAGVRYQPASRVRADRSAGPPG